MLKLMLIVLGVSLSMMADNHPAYKIIQLGITSISYFQIIAYSLK